MSGPTKKQIGHINSPVNARSQDDARREVAKTMGRSMSAAKADASRTIDRFTVARTILAQLGGNRFIAMTGAHNFVSGKTTLSFRIGHGAKDRIRLISIQLDPSDTYTATAYRITRNGLNLQTVAQDSGLYAGDLRPWFTRVTGFDTHL